MEIFNYISTPKLIAALVAAVNILTELTKKIVTVKKPERVVLAWAELLSIAVSATAAVLQGWTAPVPLGIAVAVGALIGALVAYAAMFGYDELYGGVGDLFGGFFGYITGRGGDRDDQQPRS